jgi:hypothetical protein
VLENTNKSTDAIEIAIEKKIALTSFRTLTFSESLHLIFYDYQNLSQCVFLLLL